MMNIILEGCDKTGKTTLAKMLCDRLYLPYKHFSAPPTDLCKKSQIEFQRKIYADDISFMPQCSCVYDRFMLGEQVYAPIYRGYAPTYTKMLERAMPKDTYLILVKANISILKKRYDGIFIKKEDIPKISKAFDIAFKSSKIKNKLIINTSNETKFESFNKIMQFIRQTIRQTYPKVKQ